MLTVLQVYPNCGYVFVSPSFFLAFLISPHLSTLHWKIFTILNLWFNILSYMFLVLVIKRCKITNIQWRKFSWPALFPYQLYSRKEWLCYNESFPPRKHFLRTCRLLLVTLMRSKQLVTTTIMIHTCFNSAVNSERSHILFMLWDKYPESRCPLNVEVKLEVKHDRLSKYIYLAFVLKCQHSGWKSIFFLKVYTHKDWQNSSSNIIFKAPKQSARHTWLTEGWWLESKTVLRVPRSRQLVKNNFRVAKNFR